MERFIIAIQKYLSEFNDFIYLKIAEYDNKKIQFEDTLIDIKFELSWETLLGRGFAQIGREELNKIYENSFRDIRKIKYLLHSLSFHEEYCKDNNDFYMFIEVGFRKALYAEFILLKKFVMHDDKVLESFTIENVNINVGVPSESFLMINEYLIDEPGFLGWDNYWTIKINGIEDMESLEDYLQQAFFLLNLSSPSTFKFGYEDINFSIDDSAFRAKFVSRDFQRANFIEPIAFFNEATKRIYVNMRDETAFTYFYKVIEYFYFINQKNSIQQVLEDYSSNINRLIIEISNIYKTDELSCLKLLFNNSEIKPEVESVAYQMFKNSIIPDKGVKTLAGKLYLYRNSIVHGKGGTKFELKVPRLLEESEKQESMAFYWNWSLQKLALKCIKAFCYSNDI